MNPGEESIRAELRLRPDPPRVTRLSRKVLLGLAGAGGVVVLGALVWALDNRRQGEDASGDISIDHRTPADGLNALPRDYTGIPKLGPPLPGDLGRPIRRAQEEGKPVPIPAIQAPQVDPEEERRRAEMEAARLAQLFADTATRGEARAAPTLDVQNAGLLLNPDLAAPVEATQDATDRQNAFLEKEVDRRIVSAERLQPVASPYVVQSGSVIPAALLTGIRSDLPGTVSAQVTGNVFDTPTGAHLLIPQGARLIGEYDSRVIFGQKRVLLAWTRLIMPDGRSIVLERVPASDVEGYSGLEDGVDNHFGQLFKAALLSTLLGVGTELSLQNESDIARAIRESAQDNASDIGEEIVRRQLDVKPTLTIRQGFPLRVLVNRDLVLAPYQAGASK